MKYILILLVLANFGFLAWNYTQPLAAPENPAPRPLLNTGLTLVSEYQAATDALGTEARRQCSLVSGFEDSRQAESFMELARQAGLQALLQIQPGSEPSQYRVYLPPTPSREIANLTLADISDRLQAADLGFDTYLITRESWKMRLPWGFTKIVGSPRRSRLRSWPWDIPHLSRKFRAPRVRLRYGFDPPIQTGSMTLNGLIYQQKLPI